MKTSNLTAAASSSGKLEFHNKNRPEHIYSVEDVSELVFKVKDMFLDSHVLLGGSLATFHCLPEPSLKFKYARTMNRSDIDIFILERGDRRLATYVFNQLITSHLGCIDLEKPGDPEYYLMKGIRKIYSLHSGKYNRKVNLIIVNGDRYCNRVDQFLNEAMGHSLAMCAYAAPILKERPLEKKVSRDFKESIVSRRVKYKSRLLNTNALAKLNTRVDALGFSKSEVY
mgnify:CR=1 FL=1